VNIIPIRTPILLTSAGSVRDATQAAGRLTKAPEKKPYRDRKTTKLRQVLVPSQPNVITEPARENTVMTLRVPNLSESKLGRRRPKVAVA
jgi:hypothetical protein